MSEKNDKHCKPEPHDKMQRKLYDKMADAMPGAASGRKYSGRTDKPDLAALEP